MHTSVIEVASPAWPVPVQEPKYARELRRVSMPVEANDASWSAIKGTWEIGTQVVMLNDAMKIAEELQYKVDWLTRHVEVIERDNTSLHREKMRLQDEVDECMRRLREVIVERDEWYVKAKPTDARVVELTKERDELQLINESLGRLNSNVVNYSEKIEKERDTLREQLATVRAELTDWRDTAEALYKAVPVAYKRGQLPENGKRKPSEMVKEYLAELQAEAAAFVDACKNRKSFGGTYLDDRGEFEISVSFKNRKDAMKARDKLEALLNGTAGRELLDEMQRKDERIKNYLHIFDRVRIELLWLIRQTKSRPGGSVDNIYQEVLAVLGKTTGSVPGSPA